MRIDLVISIKNFGMVFVPSTAWLTLEPVHWPYLIISWQYKDIHAVQKLQHWVCWWLISIRIYWYYSNWPICFATIRYSRQIKSWNLCMAANFLKDSGTIAASIWTSTITITDQRDLSLLIVADCGTLQTLYKWKYAQLLVTSSGSHL